MSCQFYQLGRNYISSIRDDEPEAQGYAVFGWNTHANEHELLRLNLLHFLWKEYAGYLLHPELIISEKVLMVVDVGTDRAPYEPQLKEDESG